MQGCSQALKRPVMPGDKKALNRDPVKLTISSSGFVQKRNACIREVSQGCVAHSAKKKASAS